MFIGQLLLCYRWRYRCEIAGAITGDIAGAITGDIAGAITGDIASEIIGIYHWCYHSYLLVALFNGCAIVGTITGASAASAITGESVALLLMLSSSYVHDIAGAICQSVITGVFSAIVVVLSIAGDIVVQSLALSLEKRMT